MSQKIRNGRRNLILISVFIIVVYFGDGCLTGKVSFYPIGIDFNNVSVFSYLVIFLFLYFLYRYYVLGGLRDIPDYYKKYLENLSQNTIIIRYAEATLRAKFAKNGFKYFNKNAPGHNWEEFDFFNKEIKPKYTGGFMLRKIELSFEMVDADRILKRYSEIKTIPFWIRFITLFSSLTWIFKSKELSETILPIFVATIACALMLLFHFYEIPICDAN